MIEFEMIKLEKRGEARWSTSNLMLLLLVDFLTDAGCKLRPSEEENAEMCRTWPEWKDSWDYYFKNKPDKPVILTSIISGFFGE